jgi:hypothetical protein
VLHLPDQSFGFTKDINTPNKTVWGVEALNQTLDWEVQMAALSRKADIQ